jgi:hypothetical protein
MRGYVEICGNMRKYVEVFGPRLFARNKRDYVAMVLIRSNNSGMDEQNGIIYIV